MHGEYRMLKIHGNIAISLGIPKENVFINENGDVLNMKNEFIIKDGKVPADDVYIDGNDLSGLNANVIRDRKVLNDEGLIITALNVDTQHRNLVDEPIIFSRGFMYLEDNDVLDEIKDKVKEEILLALKAPIFDEVKVKHNIEQMIKKYVYSLTERSPMIIILINKMKG